MKLVKTFAGAVLFAGLMGQAALGAAIEDIKARGKLVCGISSANPPFGYLDIKTKKVVGFEIDLCEMVADSLGVDAELKEVSGAGKVPELLQGRIDVVVQLLAYSEERANVLDFTGQYVRESFSFMVREDSPVKSVDELATKRIGVVAGSFLEPMIPQRLPNATVVAFEGQPANFLALQQSKVDASAMRVSQALALEFEAGNGAPVRELDGALASAASAFGVRKGQEEWRDYLNAFLVDLETGGKGQALWDKWLGADSPYKLPRNFEFGGDVR